ncbi:iduronate 2-sulfatase isoform X2 [Petromyzon marinus]|uniref:iduronate 2-sulfatase isoform X2 n=1 Tax=Petromyzon marinus TaxID=7757 RepID=UPI003F70953E
MLPPVLLAPRAGRVCADPVELVDVFPTLVELLLLPPLPACPAPSFGVELCTEGRSRAAFILLNTSDTTPDDDDEDDDEDDDDEEDDEEVAYSQYPRPGLHPGPNSDLPSLADIRVMGYSARTRRYRYSAWVPFDPRSFRADFSRPLAREFYLLGRDPGEDHNRAGPAGYGGAGGPPPSSSPPGEEVDEVDEVEQEEVEEEVKHAGAMKRLAARVARKFGAVN